MQSANVLDRPRQVRDDTAGGAVHQLPQLGLRLTLGEPFRRPGLANRTDTTIRASAGHGVPTPVVHAVVEVERAATERATRSRHCFLLALVVRARAYGAGQ